MSPKPTLPIVERCTCGNIHYDVPELIRPSGWGDSPGVCQVYWDHNGAPSFITYAPSQKEFAFGEARRLSREGRITLVADYDKVQTGEFLLRRVYCFERGEIALMERNDPRYRRSQYHQA